MKLSKTNLFHLSKISFLFFYLLSCITSLSAQQLEKVDPAVVNVSQERLQRIDDYIKKSIKNDLIPGGVFLVARKGKIVYNKSFGKRDGKNPYSDTDIFRIASMTKAVTTVAILQLYERGLLSLDDPIYWFLPEFKQMSVITTINLEDSTCTTVPATKEISIRHLLTHTSGISYGWYPDSITPIYAKHKLLNVYFSNSSMTNKDLIGKVAKLPLVFEPGSAHLYGMNMDVLGWIVEKISGLPLNVYFKKNIFEPIGMEDTYFYLPEEKHDQLVPVMELKDGKYSVVKRKLPGLDDNNYPLAKDNGFYAGGGGLSSTALDYAKFIQMLLNDGIYGNNRILNPQTIDLINADERPVLHLPENAFSKKSGVTLGLGFRVYTDKAIGLTIKSPGTYEWGGAFNTQYFIDPVEDLIFVGMTQTSYFKDDFFWKRLYAIVYGSLEN